MDKLKHIRGLIYDHESNPNSVSVIRNMLSTCNADIIILNELQLYLSESLQEFEIPEEPSDPAVRQAVRVFSQGIARLGPKSSPPFPLVPRPHFLPAPPHLPKKAFSKPAHPPQAKKLFQLLHPKSTLQRLLRRTKDMVKSVRLPCRAAQCSLAG